MITQQLSILKSFREKLYNFFPKRGDATMNLLDAVSSHAHHCNSVVELSEAPCFERQYSSITDAVGDGLSAANWTKIQTATLSGYGKIFQHGGQNTGTNREVGTI